MRLYFFLLALHPCGLSLSALVLLAKKDLIQTKNTSHEPEKAPPCKLKKHHLAGDGAAFPLRISLPHPASLTWNFHAPYICYSSCFSLCHHPHACLPECSHCHCFSRAFEESRFFRSCPLPAADRNRIRSHHGNLSLLHDHSRHFSAFVDSPWDSSFSIDWTGNYWSEPSIIDSHFTTK